MGWIGYMQIYFKIIGKNDTYYAMFTGDFSKSVTQRTVNYMQNSIKKAYAEYETILSVTTCTKEEYEQGVLNHDVASTSWDNSQK